MSKCFSSLVPITEDELLFAMSSETDGTTGSTDGEGPTSLLALQHAVKLEFTEFKEALANERRERAAVIDRVVTESAAGLQRHVALLQSLNALETQMLSWDNVEQLAYRVDALEMAQVKGSGCGILDSSAVLEQELGSSETRPTSTPPPCRNGAQSLELGADETADQGQGRTLAGKCGGSFEELRRWVEQQCCACHVALDSLSTSMDARFHHLETQGRLCSIREGNQGANGLNVQLLASSASLPELESLHRADISACGRSAESESHHGAGVEHVQGAVRALGADGDQGPRLQWDFVSMASAVVQASRSAPAMHAPSRAMAITSRTPVGVKMASSSVSPRNIFKPC